MSTFQATKRLIRPQIRALVDGQLIKNISAVTTQCAVDVPVTLSEIWIGNFAGIWEGIYNASLTGKPCTIDLGTLHTAPPSIVNNAFVAQAPNLSRVITGRISGVGHRVTTDGDFIILGIKSEMDKMMSLSYTKAFFKTTTYGVLQDILTAAQIKKVSLTGPNHGYYRKVWLDTRAYSAALQITSESGGEFFTDEEGKIIYRKPRDDKRMFNVSYGDIGSDKFITQIHQGVVGKVHRYGTIKVYGGTVDIKKGYRGAAKGKGSLEKRHVNPAISSSGQANDLAQNITKHSDTFNEGIIEIVFNPYIKVGAFLKVSDPVHPIIASGPYYIQRVEHLVFNLPKKKDSKTLLYLTHGGT